MKTLICYYNLDGFAIQLKNHLEDALTDLDIEWKECYIEDLKKASEDFTPTMTIHFHPNKQVYDYLEIIKETKGHKLLWDMESPYESDLVFDMAPYFYYIFTSDQNTAEALQAEFPGNSIHHVPHACNPKIHKKVPVTWEYKSDVCFIGNAYESRLTYIQTHMTEWQGSILTLVGVGYRGLDGLSEHHVFHGHISEEEMVRYINGTKIALNLHRINSDLDMANKRNIQPKHLNNRFYEICAIGKPQIVENRDDLVDEIKKVAEQKPDEYSYKARLKQYYLPLLK